MRAKCRYVRHSGTWNIYEHRFRRRNANLFVPDAVLSFYKRKNIIAASFLYVPKNADVGNESSRNGGAARCREEQEEQKKDTAYRETRALTVTSAW